MSLQNNSVELLTSNYVPVIKNDITYYGGSQMWFPTSHKLSKDYVLHHYGCGTIATADFFLYLTMQNKYLINPVTEIALKGSDSVSYHSYVNYVRKINDKYTKTHRIIAVLGTKIASAINSYSTSYGLGYRASWKFNLSYYDMYEAIEEMLFYDIPVILSIGPNTPDLWRSKGITLYQRDEMKEQIDTKESTIQAIAYRYEVVKNDVNSHYVTVTGIIKDDMMYKVLLRISSWGKEYYIDYEEYRDYIEETGDSLTSSIVYVKPF